jgi:hypothetical protein
MTNRYTQRDPHFEIICAPCRYGGGACVGTVVIEGDDNIPDGKYACERKGFVAKRNGQERHG